MKLSTSDNIEGKLHQTSDKIKEAVGKISKRRDMELEENIEKVRYYVLGKFYEVLDGEFGFPKSQSLDGIHTEYISKDIDTREFVDKGLFGFPALQENDLEKLLAKIELFYEKLQYAKSNFIESSQIKELKRIIKIIEEKLEHLKLRFQ